MRNSHAQYGELVWLPSQRTAGGNHVGELRNILSHLVPPAPLDLTVVLSSQKARGQGEGKREGSDRGQQTLGKNNTVTSDGQIPRPNSQWLSALVLVG